MASMTAAFTAGRKKYAGVSEEINFQAEIFRLRGGRLAARVDGDMEAFNRLAAACALTISQASWLLEPT